MKNANCRRKRTKKTYGKTAKRSKEIDVIIAKLYEDNATGKLTDDRFITMSRTYENEQCELKDKINQSEKELELFGEQKDNSRKFVSTIKKYANINELDATILNELINKIEVYECEYDEMAVASKRFQSIINLLA